MPAVLGPVHGYISPAQEVAGLLRAVRTGGDPDRSIDRQLEPIHADGLAYDVPDGLGEFSEIGVLVVGYRRGRTRRPPTEPPCSSWARLELETTCDGTQQGVAAE